MTGSELFCLVVKAFCYFTYLAARHTVDAETLDQAFHSARRNSVDIGLLYGLYQSSFAASVYSHEGRDIAAVSQLWDKQVHSPHTRIPSSGPVPASVARTSVCSFAPACSQLSVHFCFHKLFTQPFKKMEHRVWLAQTLEQQFVEHRGKIFLDHLKSPYVLGFGEYPLYRNSDDPSFLLFYGFLFANLIVLYHRIDLGASRAAGHQQAV